MNILPKKSWHVRTRKNIERVKRDEAEAEKAARVEQTRRLQVEQEARARELRARAGIPEPEASKHGHFNLFEGHKERQELTNDDQSREKRLEEEKWQERVGILNRLVRSDDVTKPWYCADGSRQIVDSKESEPNGIRSNNLITQMYDPMTAIKSAEEIVRARRRAGTQSLLPRAKPEQARQVLPAPEDSDSSLEIVKEVKARAKVEKHQSHRSKKGKKSSKSHLKKSHKPKKSHRHHRKHKKHKE